MSVRLTLLALAALALATGCEIASAQVGPDGGVTAARRRTRDAGAAGEEGTAPPRRARDAGAASDGGARRARPRRDGGARRARDVGSAATEASIDAGIGDLTAPGTESALDGGLERVGSDDAMVVSEDGGTLAPSDGSVAEAWLDGAIASPVAEDAGPGDGAEEDDAGGVAADAGVLADDADASASGDAGTTSAVAAVPPAETPTALPPWLDPWDLFAREREAREDEARADERGGTAAPIVTVLPGGDGAPWERLKELVPALPSRRGGMLVLLFLIAVAALGARSIGRARDRLPPRGAIPRFLALAHALLRIAVALLALGVIAQLVPDWARPALPWVVVATAVALGWSARDLLPDLVAGAVLLAERRLTRGEHVAVGDHAGVVIDVGLRVTTLRDGEGRTVLVPNRVVLASPTATRRAGRYEIRVRVRAKDGPSGDSFARALRDAVLLSPYVPIPTRVEVARDPDEPGTYLVRATLLDARYEERFRGELLTRATQIAGSERAASAPDA